MSQHAPITPRKALAGRALRKLTGLVAEGSEEGENRQSDCVIRQAQVEEASEAAFLRAEET